MKLVNNNISPLPFYDDIRLQNHRKDYAFGQVYPLAVNGSRLIPFQAVLSGGTAVSQVRLYNFDTDEYTDITDSMNENGLTVTAYTEFSVLKYPGMLPVVEIKHPGGYYLAIDVTGLGTIYSDVFSVCFNIDDYLLIEYKNSYNFEMTGGMVDFSDNFMFRCYLDTQVGRPEYDFEEEATERMGYSFIESQVSKKIYKFTFLAPEYLCDALRIVRLCDTKRITSRLNTYELTAFSMEPEWEDQGDLASVECEFETDTVIANIGGYEPELAGGDFNGDYNEDYLIEDVTPGINIVVTGEQGIDSTMSLPYYTISTEATSAVLSDVTVQITYQLGSDDPQTTTTTIQEGRTSGGSTKNAGNYRKTFRVISAIVTSQGSDDDTNYRVSIVNPTMPHVTVYYTSDRYQIYAELEEAWLFDIDLTVKYLKGSDNYTEYEQALTIEAGDTYANQSYVGTVALFTDCDPNDDGVEVTLRQPSGATSDDEADAVTITVSCGKDSDGNYKVIGMTDGKPVQDDFTLYVYSKNYQDDGGSLVTGALTFTLDFKKGSFYASCSSSYYILAWATYLLLDQSSYDTAYSVVLQDNSYTVG